MAAILKSAMLDSATTILDSDTLLSSLSFTHSQKNKLSLTQLDDGRYLDSFNLAILDSAILVFPFKLTHKDWFPTSQKKTSLTLPCLPFAQENSNFRLNLMMAAIFEFCHLGFRHCHLGFRHLSYLLSDSLKDTLTPLWLWLKLIQSDSNSFILT